jgi:hypothetical protein
LLLKIVNFLQKPKFLSYPKYPSPDSQWKSFSFFFKKEKIATNSWKPACWQAGSS